MQIQAIDDTLGALLEVAQNLSAKRKTLHKEELLKLCDAFTINTNSHPSKTTLSTRIVKDKLCEIEGRPLLMFFSNEEEQEFSKLLTPV